MSIKDFIFGRIMRAAYPVPKDEIEVPEELHEETPPKRRRKTKKSDGK